MSHADLEIPHDLLKVHRNGLGYQRGPDYPGFPPWHSSGGIHDGLLMGPFRGHGRLSRGFGLKVEHRVAIFKK